MTRPCSTSAARCSSKENPQGNHAVRYFIDTNIFIFLCKNQDELAPNVMALFADYENMFIMSSESLQEIAVLLQKNKIGVKDWKSYKDVMASVDANNIQIRHVTPAHIKTLYEIQLQHYDPVDIMIISQAITEKTSLISSDEKFKEYQKQGLNWVPNKR